MRIEKEDVTTEPQFIEALGYCILVAQSGEEAEKLTLKNSGESRLKSSIGMGQHILHDAKRLSLNCALVGLGLVKRYANRASCSAILQRVSLRFVKGHANRASCSAILQVVSICLMDVVTLARLTP